MSEQELELPKGWVSSSVIEICEKSQYGWTTSSQPNGNLKFLRTADITSGQIDWSSVPFCKNEPKDVKKYLLNDGDIVISRAGSVGFSSLINKPQRAVFASYLIRFRPLIETKFFAYFLQSPFYWSEIHEKSLGNTLANVNATRINQIKFLLPPLNEQKRIVSKIEELFSKIDSTKQSLEQTKLQLEQYRSSLLRSAFEGKLTEKWRDTNDVVDSVSKLLEQKQNKKIQKTEIDLSALPVIPETWAWVNFNQILEDKKNAMKAGPFGSSLKKEFYVPDGYKIYGQEQVIRGDPEYGDYFIDEERFQLLKSNEVKPGDLLISLVGTVGKTLVLPDKIKKGILNPRLIKISLDKQIVDVQFIQMYFESAPAKFYFKLASHGGTMDILNMGMLKKLPIPLPVINEQKKILEKIEQGFSLIENTSQIVNSTLQTLQTMKMSVLKQAFEGKLVPQDPNDEPAHILLEKIKNTKEAKPTKKRRAKNVK